MEATGYNNVDIRWEGTDNSGNRLTDGTYFYVIQDGNGQVLKGWVELTGELK